MHKLKLVPKERQEICKDIVDILESALAKARAGDLTSLAMFFGRLDGNWETHFSAVTNAAEQIGRIEILKSELIEATYDSEP